MAHQFKPVNRDQPMMLPEDMRDWVDKDHLVWFVIDVFERLDTSALDALAAPGKGRPGYDPRMLAVLLVYSCLQGERSSRRIEQRCRTDAAFRVATGNQVPDHSTIARFRAAAALSGALEDLFFRVLFVLAVAGLGRLDVISVDGSKIWADASKGKNRTEEGLRRLAARIVADAARFDGEDCGCDGHGHGDAAGLAGEDACGCCDGGMLPGLGLDGPAVPRNGWGSAPRAQRIAAGLAELREARLAAEAAGRGTAQQVLDAARAAGRVPAGNVPRAVAAEMAELRLELALAADRDAEDRRRAAGVKGGRRRDGADSGKTLKARRLLDEARAGRKEREDAERRKARAGGKKKEDPRPVRNITDPDSRVMHCTLRGAVQAYNALAARTGDRLFLRAVATRDCNDAHLAEPAFGTIAASAEVIAAGHAAAGLPAFRSRAGTVLFDNGFFSRANIGLPGPDRLIGTGAWKDPGPHGPHCRHEDPRDQMHHHLATRQGRDLYRNRAPLSEGGFADLKERTGLRRFALRGLVKVQGELDLATLAANIHLGYRRRVRLA
jgi:transposase